MIVMRPLVFTRLICRLLIGVLVSTQLVVAAYACSGAAPLEQDQSAVVMAGHSRVGDIASDPGTAASQGDGMNTGYGGLDPALPKVSAPTPARNDGD